MVRGFVGEVDVSVPGGHEGSARSPPPHASPSGTLINEVLADLRRVPEVRGACLVRRDGDLLGHKLASGADARRIGRLVAAVLGTTEMVASELDEGGFYQAMVDCEGGRILGYRGPGDTLVVVLLDTSANLGLVMLSVRRAAWRLEGDRASVTP